MDYWLPFFASSTLILCHKHELLDQLANCFDPVLTLHLAILVIFTISTQNMLHASGKYVSTILRFLQTYLTSEQSEVLRNYHGKYWNVVFLEFSKITDNFICWFIYWTDLVLKLLTLPADSDDVKHVNSQLDDKLAAVKEVASTFKKPGVTQAD